MNAKCPYCDGDFDGMLTAGPGTLRPGESVIVCSDCQHILLWESDGPRKFTKAQILAVMLNGGARLLSRVKPS